MAPCGQAMRRYLNMIRMNDLKHIDDKLNEIHADVKAVDRRLEAHVTWHLDRDGRKHMSD